MANAVTVIRVSAECHSDDRTIEIASFDATPWFEQADDDAILKLAAEGFGCDYTADEVAEFCANVDPVVRNLFDYLATVNKHRGQRDVVGFECSVSEDEAMAWIKAHRSHLIAKIEENDPERIENLRDIRQFALQDRWDELTNGEIQTIIDILDQHQ